MTKPSFLISTSISELTDHLRKSIMGKCKGYRKLFFTPSVYLCVVYVDSVSGRSGMRGIIHVWVSGSGNGRRSRICKSDITRLAGKSAIMLSHSLTVKAKTGIIETKALHLVCIAVDADSLAWLNSGSRRARGIFPGNPYSSIRTAFAFDCCLSRWNRCWFFV